jgi:hypothetical protein
MTTHLKISIHGSCVTRDAFNYLPFSKENILYYQARSSLCTKHLPPAQPPQALLDALSNKFKTRMLTFDLSRAPIPNNSPIIFDLIDERFEICSYQGVSYTQSENPQGITSEIIHPKHSKERLSLFSQGVSHIYDRLKNTPVLLHKAYYATHYISDDNLTLKPLPADEEHIRDMNTYLDTLHDAFLKAIPHAIPIEVDHSLRVANPNHIWGLAPYHYIDDYYASLQRLILDALK